MRLSDIPLGHPYHRKFHLRGSTMVTTLDPDSYSSQISRLVAMNTRLETRLRVIIKERDNLDQLLREANAALADAGIPYKQGNIRERINAYQVFKSSLIFNM